MTHHIQGKGRHQVTLFPDVLDDFVTEDNPVRVIDVFVDELQLGTLGFEHVNAKQSLLLLNHIYQEFNLVSRDDSYSKA